MDKTKKDTEINVRKFIVGNLYRRAKDPEATLLWDDVVTNVFPDPSNPYVFRITTREGRAFKVHVKEVDE